MAIRTVPESQVLKELRALDRSRWQEVIDFIIALKGGVGRVTRPGTEPLTADALLKSGLVGLWSDRDDIGDSVEFARQLRRMRGLRTIRPYAR